MPTPLHVLILEDRPTDAELMVPELRRAEFEPIWRRVESRQEYLDHLDPSLDVILADYALPQFDALSALHLLQERGLDIPFIVVTGSISEEAAVECMKQGAADYLLKDRLSRLGQAVWRALAEKQLREEKRQAEAALRASEARYRAISELTSDYSYSLQVASDGALACEWVTEAFTRITGVPLQEVIGQNWSDRLVHPDDQAIVARRWQALLKGHHDVSEYRIVTRSGEIRALRDHGRPVWDAAQGRVIRIYGAAQDITEHKRAEEERAQLMREQVARAEAEAAQRRFAFLAEASRTLVSSLDYETTLRGVARLAVPFLADCCIVHIVRDDGAIHRLAIACADPSKEELIRKMERHYPVDPDASHGVALVIREGKPLLQPKVDDEILARSARDDKHLRILRALGIQSLILVPLRARARTLGALSLTTAASGRYGADDLALAEDLARRCALAVDNARLYHEAQEAIQARDGLLSIVSHDLKNPLTTIKGWTQVLRRHVAREGALDVDRLAAGLAGIDATATKMTMLIGELLDFARLQRNQPLDLDRRPTDLVALTRQVIAEHQQMTEHHDIELETTVSELVGVWDPVRLERVLANLLSNAIKYSPSGGSITVSVATEAPNDARSAGYGWATLAVRDQGVGIPAGDLPHIFERFHRAANVAGRVDGTGIGLSSVRQIVEQHGGTVSATSEEGVGSIFTVRLPLAGLPSE